MDEKELIKLKLRELQNDNQNKFIDKVATDIEFLLEKSNKRDYIPTEHEREVFGKIFNIITDMNKWF